MREPMIVHPVWNTREFSPPADLCFVLLPFTQDWSAEIYGVIGRAVQAVGLRVTKADELFGRDIMEDVWLSLNTARVVIADITGQNANVMYELGIAHTLGKPLVLLSADGGGHIPFDIRRFRHILYDRERSGLRSLKTQIRDNVRVLMEESPPGAEMERQVEEGARFWEERFHDPLSLGSEGLLQLVRKHGTDPKRLTPRAIAYCLATAAHYGSVDNMVYWGRICSTRPEAAERLAFFMRHRHRRPKLRLGHVVEQFSPDAKKRALTRMTEQNVDSGLVEAVATGRVREYVRDDPDIGLETGLRKVMLAEMEDTVL